ncbi:MAG: RNA polymerase sigma factor [Prevotella sp.]|nr:RNA polymerase sigma factor [Prevotella sp.]
MTEQQIVEAIKRGSRQAMRALYDSLAGFAMATALRYSPEQEEAKDILQDSFLKVFGHFDQFHYQGEGSLKAWVLKIVSNEAISHLNKQARIIYTDTLADQPEEEEEVDINPIPPKVLTQMIGSLPPGYRMVFNLHVFEEKSHKEIGHLLGIKENSSASQFLRAKRILAKLINEYKTRHHEE